MLGEDDHNEIDNEPLNAEDLFADLEEENNVDEGQDNDNSAQEEGGNNATPAGEEPQQKKHRQINRLPNLNDNWLVDSRRENIRKVNGYFEKIKFKKGKGQEGENLKMILQRYEYFAQNCYPKLCFTDFVEKVEYVSGKRTIKHVLQDIRQGRDLMPSDSDSENENEGPPIRDMEDPMPNVPSPNMSPSRSPSRSSEKQKSPSPEKPKSVMTEEMREIIRKKREEALAKRQQRLNESVNEPELLQKHNDSNDFEKECNMNSNTLVTMSSGEDKNTEEESNKDEAGETDFVIETESAKILINENKPRIKIETKQEEHEEKFVENITAHKKVEKESDIVENSMDEPETDSILKSEKRGNDDVMEVDA